MQTSEQTAHDRAAAAEVSSRQLAQEAQELQDSRDAAVALQQQLEQALQQSCHLAEVRVCAIWSRACAHPSVRFPPWCGSVPFSTLFTPPRN